MINNHKYIGCIIILFWLICCTERKAALFEVAYEVKLFSPDSTKIRISYIDATGEYVTFETSEKEWRKEVVLPADQMACLQVMISSGTDDITGYNPQLFRWDKKRKQPLISGKIIHAQSTTEKSHPDQISISLHPSEIKEERFR